MTEALVQVENLSRYYHSSCAINRLSFSLDGGEVLGFLGPNGAGKSTTMQVITGNLAPSEGQVSIAGHDILEAPRAAKACLGYLPEHPPVYRDASVDEFLRFCARLHRIPSSGVTVALERVKQQCGLEEVGRRLIGNLSKGYQQRVGIAQAIVHAPDVVILDEPTIGLDPNQIREIRALIRELGGTHSVVLSTHILPEVEMICDRVQIMHHGSIVYSDTIAALKQFERGATIVLGLRRPPPNEELAAVPGIAAVERTDETLFRVQVSPGADPTDALVSHAAARDWRLYRIAPAQNSLEDVFVNLTRRENDV